MLHANKFLLFVYILEDERPKVVTKDSMTQTEPMSPPAKISNNTDDQKEPKLNHNCDVGNGPITLHNNAQIKTAAS